MNVNEAYSNFSYNLSRSDSGDSSINITVYYAEDIEKQMIHYEIYVQKDKLDRNYGRQLIKSSINVCRMVGGILSDFVAKMIMDDIQKYIDFELKCPFKKVSKLVS